LDAISKRRNIMQLQPTLAIAAALFLVSTSHSQADNAEAFRTAERVSELSALGAKQLPGSSIEQILTSGTLTNPGWTWDIEPDGTQSSEANDGSWSDEGTWEVRGNEFCRESTLSEGKTLCSKVYYLGRELRFSENADPRNLLDWYLTY
jgi:hypothetical protein